MTRAIQRLGDMNTGAGSITNTPQGTVFANNLTVAVNGSSVAPHQKHIGVTTRGGIGNVFINNIPVIVTGNTDSCGHQRICGSPNVFAGDSAGESELVTIYVGPTGVVATYKAPAQKSMGTESPTTILPPQDGADTTDDGPPNSDPVSCSEFNDQTSDDVQLSANYKLSDVTLRTVFPHRVVPNKGLSRPDIICNLKQMCESVGEAMRSHVQGLGHQLTITSSFRPESGTSHHNVGAAFDMQVLTMSPAQIFEVAQWARDNLPVDQIILEGVGASKHWIHCSMGLKGVQTVGGGARVLTQTLSGGYSQGLILLNYA